MTYFLNGPMFSLLFYCGIILHCVKVTSYEKFSQNLTLEVKIVWEIIDGTIKMLKRSRISKTFN